MAHAETRGPTQEEELEPDARWRASGERIQGLVDALAAGGPVARGRAEELVRELSDLYGAGMYRTLTLVGESNPAMVERLAADDLVGSLMLVHALHPHGVERRIEDALDKVRPYLGSHGGDVQLLEVEGGVVRLELQGNCKSCPSSAVTLELTVEDAVRAAAPEITSIDVVAAKANSASGLISVDSLMSRVHASTNKTGNVAAAWHPVPDIGELTPGEVGGFLIAGVPVLACRIGDELFVYHDRCGNCGESLAGAALHRPMGAPIGQALLRCPRCQAHFDAVHAGACIDETAGAEVRLVPIPLLVRDGVLSAAVLAEATGVS